MIIFYIINQIGITKLQVVEFQVMPNDWYCNVSFSPQKNSPPKRIKGIPFFLGPYNTQFKCKHNIVTEHL